MLTRTLAAMLTLATTTAPCLSEDIPYAGIAYNTKENNSVQYTCVKRGALLDCDFVQTRVRLKANPDELRKFLADAMKQYESETEQIRSSDMCNNADKVLSVLEGTIPSSELTDKMIRGMGDMTPIQKRDMTKSMRALKELCENPTEARFADMVEASHDIETRTCIISSNSYKQQFRKVMGSEVWVVAQDGPEGMCGIVNVSRFEKDTSSSIPFWNYFGKKVVTNKSSELLPGMKCSDLDEGEYEFNWMRRVIQLSCDYIEFGAF